MKVVNGIRNLAKHSFIRNSAVLMSGNILGQVISMLFYLLLCRIYTPNDFGAFAVFMSYAGFLAIVATGCYHYAIILPDNDDDVKSVMKLCTYCVLLTGIATLILLVPTELLLMPRLYDSATVDIFWLMPLYIWTFGIWKIFEYWHVRQANYKTLSTYQLSQNLSSSIIKTALWQTKSGIGLALGTIMGQIAAIAISLVKDKTPLRAICLHHSFHSVKKVAKRYVSFPRYSLPRDAINYLASNSVYLILSPFFGTYELGLFMMAASLSLRPLILVNNAIGHNIMQSIADKLKAGIPIIPAIKKYLATSTAVMLPAFTVLFFIVKPICVLLLGQEWEHSGTYLQYMLPWLCALAIFSPLAPLPDILGKQKTDMFLEIASILIRILMLLIGIAANSFKTAIIAYCAGAFLITTIRGIWYVRIAVRHDHE